MKFRAKNDETGFKWHGSRKDVLRRLSELPYGEFDINITRHFDKRSNKLNAYYWGCVVQTVFEGLRAAGFEEIKSQDDAHSVLKEMFFKKTIFSEQKDNLVMSLSTTQFTNAEFLERLELIKKWAFEYLGCTILDPNSQAAMDFT